MMSFIPTLTQLKLSSTSNDGFERFVTTALSHNLQDLDLSQCQLGDVNGVLGAINLGNAGGGTNWPGGAFDPERAKALEDNILSTGGSREAEELYLAFRGRLPGVEALLKGRGLIAA